MCEVNSDAHRLQIAIAILQQYILQGMYPPPFPPEAWQTIAAAAIVGAGAAKAYPDLITGINFENKGQVEDEPMVILRIDGFKDPTRRSELRLIPSLLRTLRVISIDADGKETVLKEGSPNKRTTPAQDAGEEEVRKVIWLALRMLHEAIDRGITLITGWPAGVPHLFTSTITDDDTLELKATDRLAQVLVHLSDAGKILKVD